VAASAIVVLVLLTLSSSLLGGNVFGSGDNMFSWAPFHPEQPANFVRPTNRILTDPVLGFNPDLLLARSALSQGTAPLWNPDIEAGRPLLASQLPALLFPTTWLAFVLPFWTSLAWIAAAKLLLAAAGAYLLCRDLRLRRGPSLLGAVVFAFGFYFFVWLQHPLSTVWSVLPWMLLATRRVCIRGSLAWAAALGFAVGLSWFAGHPESAGLAFGVTVVYGFFELLSARAAGEGDWAGPAWTRGVLGRTGLFAAALVLGLGLTAMVNIPFAELLGQARNAQRGGPGYSFRFAWMLFFPELWGAPNKAYLLKSFSFNEHMGYIGALPLLLACASIGRRRPREQWFFVGLAVISVLTIFDTPIWSAAVRDLPEGRLAALGRLMIMVSLSGAVLAAYGLQRWLEGSLAERRRMLIVMSAVALVPALVWVLTHTSELSRLGAALGQLPTVHAGELSPGVVALGSVWRWVLVCAIGIAALLLLRRRGSPVLVIAVVIGLTAFDLIALDRPYHGAIPQSEANPPVPSAIRYLQLHQGEARVIGNLTALPANLAERYGLKDARAGVDLPFPSRYADLWTRLDGLGGDERSYDIRTPRAQLLADVFAARYVLLIPGEPVPGWLRTVFRSAGGTVAENPSALPRAWVAYGWRQAYAEPNSVAETALSTSAQLERAPVIEGAPAPPAGPVAPPSPARLTTDGFQRVTVEATATRPGYLVLDDAAYPGWDVTVDGHGAAWKPANANFRAVALTPGHHVVTFLYRPSSVIAGGVISAVCALALIALALLSVRFRTRRADR
jgi:hypothetical protein